jgi:hypothetical protein
MKAIAVLTMIFLPGTYIAVGTPIQTLFAMPILDFTTDHRLPSLKHTFWLYWAVAVPVTAVVLLLYAIFQVYVEEKHRREDQVHDVPSLREPK